MNPTLRRYVGNIYASQSKTNMNSNTYFCKITIHEIHLLNKSSQLTKVYAFCVEDECGEKKCVRVLYYHCGECNESFYELK